MSIRRRVLEDVDITPEVGGAEELKQLCQTEARINKGPFQCTVVWKERERRVTLNRPSEIEVAVHVNLPNGTLSKRKPQCQLETSDGISSKCDVDHIEGQEYRIQYTPQVRGRCELILIMNGVKVGSHSFVCRAMMKKKKCFTHLT